MSVEDRDFSSQALKGIPVHVEGPTPDQISTGNVLPLLHEIRHALRRLLESGERAVIDLRGIPFAPGDDRRLEELLGRGEVEAKLDALGPSEIWETRYPGVWFVVHRNEADEVTGKFIEICECPSILASVSEDMGEALTRLEERLERLEQEN